MFKHEQSGCGGGGGGHGGHSGCGGGGGGGGVYFMIQPLINITSFILIVMQLECLQITRGC